MPITTFNLQLRKYPHTSKTQDFLNKLEKVKDIPQQSLLVTLDVESLQTNIPNNEGIKVVKEPYEKYKEKAVSTKVILTFYSLTLTLNNFVFSCTHYLQTMGCDIDTICAPSYVRSADLLNCNFKTCVNTDQTRLERPSLVKVPLLVWYSSPILAFVLQLNGSRGQ